MPLSIKPHTWTARKPDPDMPGGLLEAVEVRGRIKQSDPTEAVASFGDPAGSISRPFVALCDTQDADKHEENGLVEWNGRRFSIELGPVVHPATDECSYAKVLLSELVEK